MSRAGRNVPKHVASPFADRPVDPSAGSATDPAAGPDAGPGVGSRVGPRVGRHVAPRHKGAGVRRQVTRVVGSAVLAVSLAGTVAAQGTSDEPEVVPAPTPAATGPVDLSQRTVELSRSTSRAVDRAAERAAVPAFTTARRVALQPEAVDHRFATVPLNVRTEPSPDSERVRTVPFAARLAVTGQTSDGWAEVLMRREQQAGEGDRTVTVVRWVNAAYLADRKPEPPEPEPEPEEAAAPSASSSSSAPSAPSTTTGLSGAACPDGSSIEAGLTSSAVRLYRAVCAAHPALATYGGYDNHGEHVDGRAIDFMVTDSALGQAVADYLLANAGTLGIRDIIWAQRIWTPERSSEGWRYMPDRGSPTANHYDHVHVAV